MKTLLFLFPILFVLSVNIFAVSYTVQSGDYLCKLIIRSGNSTYTVLLLD